MTASQRGFFISHPKKSNDEGIVEKGIHTIHDNYLKQNRYLRKKVDSKPVFRYNEEDKCESWIDINKYVDKEYSMINELIQKNFMGIVIILFLILFIVTNNNFDKRTNRLFLCSAICVLLFIVEEIWEGQLALEPSYSQLRVVLSAIGYVLRPMTAYFLVMIICGNLLKWKILLSIPVVINAIVSFSAMFGKWSFWYTEANEFVRGPLGIVPFITAAIYVVTLLVLTIFSTRKGDKMEAMTVFLIVVLTVSATIMETVFSYRSIQSAASGISITFYYLFLHTNQNNRDPLTQALVRRRFYLDAERYRNTLSAVISLDLNDLKKLNDQYGHIAGDKALITMTETLQRCISKRASLYRTGGDEFMMLCYKMDEEVVQALVKRIKDEMDKTDYRCAVGYAMYNYRTELDHVCQIADKAMYVNKFEMKKGI